jgi:putative acetyltransferase
VSSTEIIQERVCDADAVADVHRAAFGEHGEEVAALVADLRALARCRPGLSLVAVRDRQVVGHAMFSGGLLDAPPRLVDVQILSPIGVRPESQRQGIGSALVERGLAILSSRAVPAVFLEGDPRYYGRFGFEPGDARGFRKPSLRIPDAGFQVMILPAPSRG